MNPSKPWLDEGAPRDVAGLLRAGQCEQPGRARLQRALVAVGAAGAASAAAASAAAAASGAASAAGTAVGAGGKVAAQGVLGLLTKWTALSAIGTGAIVGTATGVAHYRTRFAPSVHSDARARAPMPRPSIAPHRLAPPAALSATLETQGQSAAPAPLAARVFRDVNSPKSATRESPAAEEAAPNRLAEEVVLIDRARAALRTGNPGETVRLVNEYNQTYNSGRFMPESAYLKMEAALRMGDNATATRMAQDIVNRYPNGPQVGRALEVLRQTRPPQNP